MIQMIRRILKLDQADKITEGIYNCELQKINKVDKKLKQVNKLLHNKSVSYNIGVAIGAINNV